MKRVEKINEQTVVKMINDCLKRNGINYIKNLSSTFLELGIRSIVFIQIIIILEEIYGIEMPDEYLVFNEKNSIIDLVTIMENLKNSYKL